MSFAQYCLLGRVVLLGAERIVVKRMGDGTDPFGATFLCFAVGALAIAPLAWGEAVGGWGFVPGMLAASAVYAVAFVYYVRSLAAGDASLVSPLYNVNVVALALMAWLVLCEPPTWGKAGGIALLLYGASWLRPRGSLWKSLTALGEDAPCRHMVAASLLIGVGRLFDKGLGAPPMTYDCLLYTAIAGWLFLYLALRGRTTVIAHAFRTRPGAALLGGAVNGYSYVLMLHALKGIEVSRVEPASMTSMLVTLVLARLVLGEHIGTRWVAAVFMVAGAWLLVGM